MGAPLPARDYSSVFAWDVLSEEARSAEQLVALASAAAKVLQLIAVGIRSEYGDEGGAGIGGDDDKILVDGAGFLAALTAAHARMEAASPSPAVAGVATLVGRPRRRKTGTAEITVEPTGGA